MSRLASLARLAAAGLFLYFGVMFAVIGLINVGWLQGRGAAWSSTHRTGHYVVDLVCAGEVLEPEVMAPGRVVKAWFRDDFTPEDGAVLTDVSFDELKRTRASASA